MHMFFVFLPNNIMNVFITLKELVNSFFSYHSIIN
jgi:hypothetical protein